MTNPAEERKALDRPAKWARDEPQKMALVTRDPHPAVLANRVAAQQIYPRWMERVASMPPRGAGLP